MNGTMGNEAQVWQVIAIAVGVIFLICAILIIINMVMNYKLENKKIEDIKEEKRRNNEKQNQAMQMAFAGGGMQPYPLMQSEPITHSEALIQAQEVMQSQLAMEVQPIIQEQEEMQMQALMLPEIETLDEQQVTGGFYQSVGHFTDTGRSGLYGGYVNGGTWSDRNFVIIKSVISTETREEIELS